MERHSYDIDVLTRQLSRIDSMAAVRNRKHPHANVWIFHSAKNGKRFAVEGDGLYVACVLYEADVKVSWYLPEQTSIKIQYDQSLATIKYDLEVHYVDGRTEWIKVRSSRRSGPKTGEQVPHNSDCVSVDTQKRGTYLVVAKEDMARRSTEFDNWLILCSAIARTIPYSQHIEAAILSKSLASNSGMRLKDALHAEGADPGRMLAAIANGIRLGTICCDLSNEPLNNNSSLRLFGTSERRSSSSLAIPAPTQRPVHLLSAPPRITVQCNNPAEWPRPDPANFSPQVREKYQNRRNAIEAYLANQGANKVVKVGGLSSREVRRLIARCKQPTDLGGIVGFYACVPGYRIKAYRRTKPVERRTAPGHGGCAGALQQLFHKHPELRIHIEDLYLKRRIKGHVHELRISKRKIWQDLLKKLRSLGYTDMHWPFNVKSRGYASVCSHLASLHETDYKAAVRARYGDNAAGRTSTGTGHVPLIEARRAYSIMQLDYQVVDADSIIVVKNRFGVEIELRVPSWYYGLMGDEYTGLITGVFIGFEVSPTSDCALKIIDSSLRPQIYDDNDPRIAYVVDGKILPNELIPELANQCFNVLRVDNAWANAARATVNNVIDVVGCAVNFGPPRAWWHRPVVERIFRDLTNRGLQRLPSSHGTGPTDPLKGNPAEKASEFRILASELTSVISAAVREHNDSTSIDRESSTPLQAIAAALAHDGSGFIRQALPANAQEDKRLLTHVEECTVRGDPAKGIRPYVKWDNCIYTNPILSQRDYLIKKTLVLYTNLDDIREVVATIKETGEDIGKMTLERKWRFRPVTVRFRKMINKHGYETYMQREDADVFDSWRDEKIDEMSKGSQSKRSSKRSKGISPTDVSMLVRLPEADQVHVTPNTTPTTNETMTSAKVKTFGQVSESDLFAIARKR